MDESQPHCERAADILCEVVVAYEKDKLVRAIELAS